MKYRYIADALDRHNGETFYTNHVFDMVWKAEPLAIEFLFNEYRYITADLYRGRLATLLRTIDPDPLRPEKQSRSDWAGTYGEIITVVEAGHPTLPAPSPWDDHAIVEYLWAALQVELGISTSNRRQLGPRGQRKLVEETV